MADTQVTIIGGGVIGLAIAAELARDHSPLFVLERNAKYGQETSSRNSEVIHAGLYYGKDSLKTRLCVEGNPMIYELCEEHSIPHKRITKIITAVDEDELHGLEALYQRGIENGVKLTMLTKEEVQAMEPKIATHGGILSPTSGIISAHGLMDYYHHAAVEHGAVIQLHCNVVGIQKRNDGYEITIKENNDSSTITSEWVINAAGLESDTIACLAGIDINKAKYRMHFCKGSYFALPGKYNNVVQRLVYPMPTKHSLGVHALPDLTGRLKFGPDVEYLKERKQDYSVDESKRHAFAESVRRILPFITDDDLSPDMSGIRPKLQAIGEPMRDFVIAHEKGRGLPGFINSIGIESPGLTASPAIAKYVREMML
ncbi:MAG TPA: NAD(P)/FAD-dependent oxidoreductase [Bacteroidota bacterium]